MGREAESRAKAFLESKGIKILDTNWRYKKLEIDIIGVDGNNLVFFEVKARSTADFGEPEIFVNPKKQRFIVEAAHHYIEQKDIVLEARFDVIAILLINNNYVVKHLKSAFYPHFK
ncbi:MAG: YraN family protein [Sphingobacteriaceae bacterium]|nr:YraN family protein [Sphingobacteriaceae bacterium]